MIKYIKPDMDIIEFDDKIRTDQVGVSDPNSTGSNEGSSDLGGTDIWD